jgi:hypothetical protein
MSYKILSHGFDNPDYFSGQGTYMTGFDNVVTDIGLSEYEAYENCIAQLYELGQTELALQIIKDNPPMSIEQDEPNLDNPELENWYYYLSILY